MIVGGKIMSDHIELIELAKEAIDRVFSDTSVEQVDTAISLKDLIDHIELMLNTLDV